MFHSYQMLFLLMLIVSTFFQLSSMSWFSVWMAMELNLLSFIPFLSNSENQLFNVGSMKYFLIQAFGSVIFMFGWLLMSFSMSYGFYYKSLSYMMLLIALFLKLGAAPFHFWFPTIMVNLSWFSSFILMTWQKLGLLMMLSYLNQLLILIYCSAMMSALIGGIGGFNQINLRKLFAYSSIGHLAWLMLSCILLELGFLIYYVFYFSMMLLFCLIFHLNHLNSLIQLFCFSSMFKFEKIIIMVSLFSLGGLPPLSGFFPKWLVLNQLLMSNMNLVSFILLLSSLMNLYYYLRIGYMSMVYSSSSISWFPFELNFKNKYMINLIITLKCFSFLFIPFGMWLM